MNRSTPAAGLDAQVGPPRPRRHAPGRRRRRQPAARAADRRRRRQSTARATSSPVEASSSASRAEAHSVVVTAEALGQRDVEPIEVGRARVVAHPGPELVDQRRGRGRPRPLSAPTDCANSAARDRRRAPPPMSRAASSPRPSCSNARAAVVSTSIGFVDPTGDHGRPTPSIMSGPPARSSPGRPGRPRGRDPCCAASPPRPSVARVRRGLDDGQRPRRRGPA